LPSAQRHKIDKHDAATRHIQWLDKLWDKNYTFLSLRVATNFARGQYSSSEGARSYGRRFRCRYDKLDRSARRTLIPRIRQAIRTQTLKELAIRPRTATYRGLELA